MQVFTRQAMQSSLLYTAVTLNVPPLTTMMR